MTDHQRGDTVLDDNPTITPNVQRLAREGIIFTNTYCPSPHCAPARATFHTGLYPSRHGVWNNVCNDQALSRGLKKGVRLWSDSLAEAGYEMHWSGKWHVSSEETPADRGWKELLVNSFKKNEHGASWEYFKEISARSSDETERGEGEILRPGYGKYKLYGSREIRPGDNDEKVVQKGIDAIKGLANGENPWCVFIGVAGPHDPYRVSEKYLSLYDINETALPPSYSDELKNKPAIYQRMRRQIWSQLSEREVREGIRHFRAYCTYLDELFGRVLKTLDETGRAEDTLVLYCSDHGDYCGDHGIFAKGIPAFRGAYHVPAVVRWPAGIKNAGSRVEQFVSLADFGPTFTDLAGVGTDKSLSGKSLNPFFRGEVPKDWRDAVFTQCNGVELYYTQRSVMTKEYKYVFNGFDFDELYDLKKDPDEMVNLIHDASYEHIKKKLLGKMWRFAYQEGDTVLSSYITVGLAPYGPAEAFSEE